MTVAHLNSKQFQIGDTRNLAHLNDGSLENHLKLFILTCRVNNLSPRTVNDYAQKIGAFVSFLEQEGITAPAEITATYVRLFLLGTQQRCKPVSVHDYYGTINRFFNWLVEEEILKESPMSRMHPPKVPKELIKPFKSQDIDDLLALCQNNFLGIRNRAIILTFLDTGLRLSELASIQLADMDLDREIIKVMGKGAKERMVRTGRETQKAILKYLLQRNDNLPCLWVTEERRPMKWNGIQIMIIRLGKRAGLKSVRCSPHTFRHTFAISCLRNGMGEFSLQWLLGHSTLQQTKKYCGSLGANEAIVAHQKASPVDNMKF
mgnify:CR=1 FL=1